MVSFVRFLSDNGVFLGTRLCFGLIVALSVMFALAVGYDAFSDTAITPLTWVISTNVILGLILLTMKIIERTDGPTRELEDLTVWGVGTFVVLVIVNWISSCNTFVVISAHSFNGPICFTFLVVIINRSAYQLRKRPAVIPLDEERGEVKMRRRRDAGY